MSNSAPVAPKAVARFLSGVAILWDMRPCARCVITWMGVALLSILLVMTAVSAVRSSIGTAILEPEHFSGIAPLEKRTTSIIVVHGIGHHCIGYADPLIASMLKDLAGVRIESIEHSYTRYASSVIASTDAAERYGVRTAAGGTYKIDTIDPARDGHCRQVPLPVELPGELPVDTADDQESILSAQDKLCAFLNHEPKTDGTRIYCHKLILNRRDVRVQGENPEYVTGFVRQIEHDISAQRRIRIYEVVWSPATRWIKKSLQEVERFNNESSGYLMNRILKSEIVNSGIADAVAYLSESGALVTYDVLQAFCLTIANASESVTSYPFVCDNEHLNAASPSLAQENDVILVTHSLGTRVILDTLGMLALGVQPDASTLGKGHLVSAIGTTLQELGADVPAPYFDPSEGGFPALLRERIPAFARAVKSIYAFTNQVPLLAASVSSPFSTTHHVGRGFHQFLELRVSGDERARPLQIISFHDPDDVLSYDLSCWYHIAVLKNLDSTLDRIDKEAHLRAQKRNTEVGEERRKLLDTMFNSNCSERRISDPADSAFFKLLRDEQSHLLSLKGVTLRLQGMRVERLLAHPADVHSNYFRDPLVHQWLVGGYPAQRR